MGTIRTPRPYYFKQGVIIFFVKDSRIFYNVLIWNEDGTNQASVEIGNLDEQTPQQIADRTLQSFSTVNDN